VAKGTRERIARLQRMLGEGESVKIVIADFARPTGAPPRLPAPRASAPPAPEPEPIDPEPRCEHCGARLRLSRGEPTCLACMTPGDPRW
jgi:hypothetical protein